MIRQKLTLLASIAVLISVLVLVHAKSPYLFDLRVLKTVRLAGSYLELTPDKYRIMIHLGILGIVFVILGVALFGTIMSAYAVMNGKATRK